MWTQEDYDSLAAIIFRGDPRYDKSAIVPEKKNDRVPLFVYGSKQQGLGIDYRDIVSPEPMSSKKEVDDDKLNYYERRKKYKAHRRNYVDPLTLTGIFSPQEEQDVNVMLKYIGKATTSEEQCVVEGVEHQFEFMERYFIDNLDSDSGDIFHFNFERHFIRKVPVYNKFNRSKGFFSRRSFIHWGDDSKKVVQKGINTLPSKSLDVRHNKRIQMIRKKLELKKRIRERLRFMRSKHRLRARCIFWQSSQEKKSEKNFKIQSNSFMKSRNTQRFPYKKPFGFSKSDFGDKRRGQFNSFGNYAKRKFSTNHNNFVDFKNTGKAQYAQGRFYDKENNNKFNKYDKLVNVDKGNNEYNKDDRKYNQRADGYKNYDNKINNNTINFNKVVYNNNNEYNRDNRKHDQKVDNFRDYDNKVKGNKEVFNNSYHNNSYHNKPYHNKPYHNKPYHNSFYRNKAYHSKYSYRKSYRSKPFYNRTPYNKNYNKNANNPWSKINLRNEVSAWKRHIRYKRKKYLNVFTQRESNEIQLLKFLTLFRRLYKILRRYSNWGALEI